MDNFTSDILKPKKLEIKEFKNNVEVVKFVLDIMDEDKKNLQEVIKTIMEVIYRDEARTTCFLNFLCDELDVDYEKIQKKTNAFLDSRWGEIKKNVKELRDIEDRINDIFKDKNKE